MKKLHSQAATDVLQASINYKLRIQVVCTYCGAMAAIRLLCMSPCKTHMLHVHMLMYCIAGNKRLRVAGKQ